MPGQVPRGCGTYPEAAARRRRRHEKRRLARWRRWHSSRHCAEAVRAARLQLDVHLLVSQLEASMADDANGSPPCRMSRTTPYRRRRRQLCLGRMNPYGDKAPGGTSLMPQISRCSTIRTACQAIWTRMRTRQARAWTCMTARAMMTGIRSRWELLPMRHYRDVAHATTLESVPSTSPPPVPICIADFLEEERPGSMRGTRQRRRRPRRHASYRTLAYLAQHR